MGQSLAAMRLPQRIGFAIGQPRHGRQTVGEVTQRADHVEDEEKGVATAKGSSALAVEHDLAHAIDQIGHGEMMRRGDAFAVLGEFAHHQPRAVGPALATEPLTIEPNTWYNPELKTAVYIVPGLVGVILTMTMVMLTSMALARERERGTLEQLIVSPVRPVELIVGKILPYVVIGYVQMTLILAAGVFVFDVSLVGSLPLLYALAFLFIAANLALGLFFSTLAKTQQQAMQMSMFFLLPNILLSGFMFPFEAMPRAAQFLAQLLPLTHFLRIVRGITLKGAHADDVASEVVWLCAILVALVALSSLRFTKKLA